MQPTTTTTTTCPDCLGEGGWERCTRSRLSPCDGSSGWIPCETCDGTGDVTLDDAWAFNPAQLAACSPKFVRAWRAKYDRVDVIDAAMYAPAPTAWECLARAVRADAGSRK